MSAPPKTGPSTGPLKAVQLPDYLADLPRLGFTTRPARSAEEAAQGDVLFNIKSLDDLVAAAHSHFPKTSGG